MMGMGAQNLRSRIKSKSFAWGQGMGGNKAVILPSVKSSLDFFF